jgi:hypothetical protein
LIPSPEIMVSWAFSNCLERELVGDDLVELELAAEEQLFHLVPRLEHRRPLMPSTVAPLKTTCSVMLNVMGLGGDAEHGRGAAVAQRAEALVDTPRPRPTSRGAHRRPRRGRPS